MVGKVYEERCRPSLIPKGGLEIVLKVSISIEDEKRRYLECLREIITANYHDPEGQESFDLSNSIQTEENFYDDDRGSINKMDLYA